MGLVEFREFCQPDRSLVVFGEEEMPAPWDRRYVQETSTTGQEVALLKKSKEAGLWLGANGDGRIYRIRIGERQHVRRNGQGGKAGEVSEAKGR